MKENVFLTICVSAVALILVSCGKSDGDRGSQATHDPNAPVTIETFMPDSGRIREKVIIKGDNFGNDKSKVEVYFIDELTERSATVIGVDNNTIYCLAPRQLDGDNQIKIVVEGKEAVAESRFGYTVADNVSTITGSANRTGTADGTLSEATFSYIHGVGALGNESILIFQRATIRWCAMSPSPIMRWRRCIAVSAGVLLR